MHSRTLPVPGLGEQLLQGGPVHFFFDPFSPPRSPFFLCRHTAAAAAQDTSRLQEELDRTTTQLARADAERSRLKVGQRDGQQGQRERPGHRIVAPHLSCSKSVKEETFRGRGSRRVGEQKKAVAGAKGPRKERSPSLGVCWAPSPAPAHIATPCAHCPSTARSPHPGDTGRVRVRRAHTAHGTRPGSCGGR